MVLEEPLLVDRQVPVLGLERPSLFSDSGNRLPLFNPFAAAMATLGPAERYESELMGASEFWIEGLNEEFQRAFEAGILWRSLHAKPVFLHEKWPPFWGSSKLIFFENVSCNRPSWYKTYQLSGSHSVEALSPKKKSICAQKAINFSIPTKIVVAA